MKIKTPNDLLEFLEIENLDPKEAQDVVNTFLETITVFQLSINELKQVTKEYISNFGHQEDRPIFLQQKTDTFNVKDMFFKRNDNVY